MDCLIDDRTTVNWKEKIFNKFKVLDIDLRSDKPNINLQNICNKHEALLYRCRTVYEMSGELVTKFFPVTFLSHDKNCTTCYDNYFETPVSHKKGRHYSLCAKCPNTEFFLVCIFPYLENMDKIRNRKYSVFGHFSGSDYDYYFRGASFCGK